MAAGGRNSGRSHLLTVGSPGRLPMLRREIGIEAICAFRSSVNSSLRSGRPYLALRSFETRQREPSPRVRRPCSGFSGLRPPACIGLARPSFGCSPRLRIQSPMGRPASSDSRMITESRHFLLLALPARRSNLGPLVRSPVACTWNRNVRGSKVAFNPPHSHSTGRSSGRGPSHGVPAAPAPPRDSIPIPAPPKRKVCFSISLLAEPRRGEVTGPAPRSSSNSGESS